MLDTKKIKPNPEQAFPQKRVAHRYSPFKKIREIRYASVEHKPNQNENPPKCHDERHQVVRVMRWVGRLFVWS